MRTRSKQCLVGVGVIVVYSPKYGARLLVEVRLFAVNGVVKPQEATSDELPLLIISQKYIRFVRGLHRERCLYVQVRRVWRTDLNSLSILHYNTNNLLPSRLESPQDPL
jgi:hypothetical protein